MNNSAVPHVTTLIPQPSRDSCMGRMLLESGKLTSEEIERVLRQQEKHGTRFGEAAQSLGLVTHKDIQQVLARQFNYPYLQPGEEKYPVELVAAYQPFTAQVEAYRALRSQLMLRWFVSGRKALALVSVDSKNGASMLIANLGVLFSQLGTQTLIMDANLRAPRQHQIFDLKGRQGLSDILAGRTGVEAIASVKSFADLSILPAGTLAPNPLELISRATFNDLTEGLSTRFDVMLIDTPAYLLATDAMAVASAVGGVLLVATRNKTRLGDVEMISEQLTRIGVEVVGSVLVDAGA
ncbi:MAG TPA: chain length determinant protein tyrosine kinase EpsG [Noviherbaspirillum sp.]